MRWLSPYERRDRNNRRRRWAIGLAAGYLLCALLDRPVFMGVLGNGYHERDWDRLFRIAGFFPAWLLVAAGFALVDRARAEPLRRVWTLVLGAGLSGLAAEVLKRFIGRERPTHHLGEYVYKKFLHGLWDDSNLGIPSSHAAVAFGGALALVRIHPPVWPLAVVIAVGCATQRVAAGAHFLSDVFGSGAVAYAVAAWLRSRQEGPLRPWES